MMERAEEKYIYSITDHFSVTIFSCRFRKKIIPAALVGPYMTEEANEFLYNRGHQPEPADLRTLPVLSSTINLSIVDPARITAALNHIAVFLYEDHHDLTIRLHDRGLERAVQRLELCFRSRHAFSIHVTEKRLTPRKMNF